MRLLLILLISFSFGCMDVDFEMPPKPTILLCTMDLPNSRGICAYTKEIEGKLRAQGYNPEIFEQQEGRIYVPIKFMDNWVVQSPDDFGKLLTYLKQIENRLKEEYENAMQMVQESI